MAEKQGQDRQKSLGFDAYKQASMINTQPSMDGTGAETEMVQQQPYTSNYAATPMKDEWNKALTGAGQQNMFQKNISASHDDDDNETMGHTSNVSWGGQSFGGKQIYLGAHGKADNGRDKGNSMMSLAEDEEQDNGYQYDTIENNSPQPSQASNGPAVPPPVSGSMMDRMNGGGALNQNENQAFNGPPPVRGSMLDRMGNNGGGGRGPPPRPPPPQTNGNNGWY